MSDDESFVVLGSSPFSSLNGKNISNKNNESLNQEIKSASLKGNSINSNLILKNSLDETQNDSFERSIKPEIKNDINSQNQDLQSLKGSSIEEKDNSFEKSGMSMAASFLLGQIEPSTMKDSVYSHFPSVNESFKSKEDIVKLQSLITSNIEMKDTLRKTNETMNEWMKKTKRTMEIYEQKLKGFQEKTDSLEEENKFLQKQLFEKVQQIEILEIKRNEEFENNISEKENKLYQLQQQILKLEEHQKNSKDLLNERKSYCEQSCVPKISHIKIVEELENKISTILAENLEIKDMQKQYIDEINCLKVNYTSLEELYKKATADIECLRNKESMKTNVLNDYEIKFKDINEEMKILQIQVETYRKDFESERESRQNMAGERDYLLVELKKLQQNNQKLIEDAELKLSKQTNMQKDRIREAQQNSKTPLDKESQVYQRVSYICPLCNRDMKTLVALQDHVQACLDEKN